MRFTPDILRQHTRVLVEKETSQNRDIVAVYLRGSLLYGSPLIGGAGDIDLVFIHNSPPIQKRQLRKLTPEIHFDIEHHDQLIYRKPRELRLDPWFGPSLRDAVPLHDPRHILDYTQSGVRSNFDFPENIHARSSQLLDEARQFWMDRQINPSLDAIQELPAFLSALEKSVNAAALLTGPPLATRRLGIDFPRRAQAVNAPGLAIAFSHLLGSVKLSRDILNSWLTGWTEAMDTLQDQPDSVPYLAEQKQYFLAAMEKLVLDQNLVGALWPLLKTWTAMVTGMPDQTALQQNWIKALTSLGFAGNDYQIKLEAFDSFLELCESLIAQESSGAV